MRADTVNLPSIEAAPGKNVMSRAMVLSAIPRRSILRSACGAGFALAAGAVAQTAEADPLDEAALIRKFVGGNATPSVRVNVQMPKHFSNGYSVPMTLFVESPMTEADYVRSIHLLAPRNPIIPVANFSFTPRSGQAKLSTRIRVAENQVVLAIAEMNDGALLLGRAPIQVDVDGCK
jgi:sulfur-oxidizing protein SoxY